MDSDITTTMGDGESVIRDSDFHDMKRVERISRKVRHCWSNWRSIAEDRRRSCGAKE